MVKANIPAATPALRPTGSCGTWCKTAGLGLWLNPQSTLAQEWQCHHPRRANARECSPARCLIQTRVRNGDTLQPRIHHRAGPGLWQRPRSGGGLLRAQGHLPGAWLPNPDHPRLIWKNLYGLDIDTAPPVAGFALLMARATTAACSPPRTMPRQPCSRQTECL